MQIIRQRPSQAGPPGPAEIPIHRSNTEPQTLCNGTLVQPVPEPQAHNLAYLPHRQSLARHSDPLLLGKESNLPVVEDRQRNRPPKVTPSLFMITGFGVHDRPEYVFKIDWNRCSRSPGIRVHDPPERAAHSNSF
jgi:hypothetical protein